MSFIIACPSTVYVKQQFSCTIFLNQTNYAAYYLRFFIDYNDGSNATAISPQAYRNLNMQS